MTPFVPPFLLKIEDVKQAARDYYAKGLLTAQAPDRNDSICVNLLMCSDDVERRCAVAAAYTEEMCRTHSGMSVASLHCGKRIEFENDDQGKRIMEIQFAHDSWARSRWSNAKNATKYENEAKQKFLDLIGLD